MFKHRTGFIFPTAGSPGSLGDLGRVHKDALPPVQRVQRRRREVHFGVGQRILSTRSLSTRLRRFVLAKNRDTFFF
jgi:hypothetical protein